MLEEITELLRRKAEIDRRPDEGNPMISYDRWIADALELLLMLASNGEASFELGSGSPDKRKPASGLL